VASLSLNEDKTVTQRLVEMAATYGCRPALVGRQYEQPYSYADLATTIQRAAAGLAWRGLRPRDALSMSSAFRSGAPRCFMETSSARFVIP